MDFQEVHFLGRSEKSQQQNLEFRLMFFVLLPHFVGRPIYEAKSIFKKNIKFFFYKKYFSSYIHVTNFHNEKLTIPGEILGGISGGAPKKF